MKPKQIEGVPEQKSGGFHDTESKKQFDNDLISQKFEILKKRFFSVNEWENYGGEAFAAFKLYDYKGNAVEREPQKGDFVRINIPGPGETEAEGYDWVEITDLCYCQDTISESIMMTCRPSRDPEHGQNKHIAHFYSSEASSTFMICRSVTHLKAAVYGRNESPNFDAQLIDVVRNMMVAAGGIVGIAKIQWKELTDGFLDFN